MVRLSQVLPSLLAAAGVASAAAERQATRFAKGTLLVELEDGQTADNFYTEVSSKASPRMNLTYSLFKGVSIQLHDDESAEMQAAEISKMPDVKKVWPVRLYSVPKHEVLWTGSDASPEAELYKRQGGADAADTYSTHVMTQVDKLRAEGYTGKGVKVAIVDTGIDYSHPALGGCFGEGCLVSYGADLVGDDYTGFNAPTPDSDPIDHCQGHGSHVAGIVAAASNTFGFTGAAPDVTLGAYRVFGCRGEVGDDVLIQAYMEAFEDGSDIISASIGGASGWSEDPWAVAVQRIVEAGVPCLVSAGNDGAIGMWYSSTAAVGKGITAIASVENYDAPALLVNSTFTLDGADAQVFGWTPGTPENWVDVELPLWAVDFDITNEASGCDPYPEDTPDLSDKVVLVRRGSCTFVQKAQMALQHGAKYLMVYNNVPGTANIQGVVDGLVGLAMVPAAQGESWIASLEAGEEVTITMLDPATAGSFLDLAENVGIGGYMSLFTSWGPSFEMDVKPQIAAPGGKILSTYPLDLGGYAVLSGTSMAAPISAAIFALVSQARGTLDPTVLENIMSATAHPQLFNDGVNTYEHLAPVPQQGGGVMQAYAAAHATSILSVSSLSFNDTANHAPVLNFSISNTAEEDVTYNIGQVAAYTAYTFYFPGDIYPNEFPNELVTDFATLSFSEDEIMIAAGETATIMVECAEPEGLDIGRIPVYSGYITLNATSGENLSLPYMGAVGSLVTLRNLDGAFVAAGTNGRPLPLLEQQAFTLPAQGADASDADIVPMVGVAMAFGTALLKVEVLDAATSESLGNIEDFPLEYLPRDPIQSNWTGKLDDGSYAPAGTYTFLVKALKIFGDRDNEEDYLEAETMAFDISYAQDSE